jgi:hypothetical protein
MTTIDEHEKTAKELIEDINEKIKANLLVERQKIIGFSASEAATNLLAAFLHKNNIVESSFNVNHRFFASEKIAENIFNFNFPNKEKIIHLSIKQEDYRNKLCYGRTKETSLVESAIKNLFELKEILESSKGVDKNESAKQK